jgi:hypothetical protein
MPLAHTIQAQENSENVATCDPVATVLTNAYGYASCAEQREGICAFLEKRAPRF